MKEKTYTLTFFCPNKNTDTSIAFKMAALNCIKYISQFSYTEEQACILLSYIPCEGRTISIVDVPNLVATLATACAIFDRDILPPLQMSKLEQLTMGISFLKINVALESSVDDPVDPKDPRLDL